MDGDVYGEWGDGGTGGRARERCDGGLEREWRGKGRGGMRERQRKRVMSRGKRREREREREVDG